MNNFFPSKHVSFNESVLGIGAIILKHLHDGKSIDDLWNELKQNRSSGDRLDDKVNFDMVILAVDFLFLVGAIKQSPNGTIVYASRPA